MKRIIFCLVLFCTIVLQNYAQNINVAEIVNRGVSLLGNTVPNGFRYSENTSQGERIYDSNDIEGLWVITANNLIIRAGFFTPVTSQESLLAIYNSFETYLMSNGWQSLGFIDLRADHFWSYGFIKNGVFTRLDRNHIGFFVNGMDTSFEILFIRE